jgi:septal ring factor EnvC (AmiA/AmiB activator)
MKSRRPAAPPRGLPGILPLATLTLAGLLAAGGAAGGLSSAAAAPRPQSQEAESDPEALREIESQIVSEEEKLRQLRSEIEKHREEAQALEARERSLSGYLDEIDREVNLAEELVRHQEAKEELLRRQVELLSQELQLEEEKVERREKTLSSRLRALYMKEEHSDLEMLLSSRSLDELLESYRTLQLVADQDRRLLGEMRESLHRIQAQRSRLTETWSEIHQVTSEASEERARLLAKKKERQSALKRVRRERSSHVERIARLEKTREELEDLLAELERRRHEGLSTPSAFIPEVAFASLKGRLPLPTRGEIVKKFGSSRHPHFGTVTFNNGVDIRAPEGTPIRCVADGRVEYVSWLQGYGNCAIVNHGDGFYTLYAHASRMLVEQGDRVDAGTVIAEVGDTGSLEGSKLHFEIRRSKQALDPQDWFASR